MEHYSSQKIESWKSLMTTNFLLPISVIPIYKLSTKNYKLTILQTLFKITTGKDLKIWGNDLRTWAFNFVMNLEIVIFHIFHSERFVLRTVFSEINPKFKIFVRLSFDVVASIGAWTTRCSISRTGQPSIDSIDLGDVRCQDRYIN